MGFKRGDDIIVAHDKHPEPNKSLTGATGKVTDTQGNDVGVVLNGETRTTGFSADELKHNR